MKGGALHWIPPFPEGEDEVSLKRHVEFLENECSRRNPDQEKIRKRMALTFPMRRRTMNHPRPINDVRSEYPALFDRIEVNTAGINLFLCKVGSLLVVTVLVNISYQPRKINLFMFLISVNLRV